MSPKRHTTEEKPTRLFVSYVVQLAFRFALLAWAVVLLATSPSALDVSRTFGPQHGIDFVDVVFVFVVGDFLTKFFVRAPISSGSLKQYQRCHIPTSVTCAGGRDALRASARVGGFWPALGGRGKDRLEGDARGFGGSRLLGDGVRAQASEQRRLP